MIKKLLFTFLFFLFFPSITIAQSQSITVQAREFSVKTSGGAVTSDTWNIWGNGYLEHFVQVNEAGTYSISIDAFGRVAENVWPNMQVYLNNNLVYEDFVSNRSVNSISIGDHQLNVGLNQIRIQYTNDQENSVNEDRNLLVNQVRFTLMSTTQAGSNTNPSSCGDSVCDADESPSSCPIDCTTSNLVNSNNFTYQLNAADFENKTTGGRVGTRWNIWGNGSISHQIDFPNTGTYEIEIRAAGHQAANIWPEMNLLVNNLLEQTFTVDSRSTNSFTHIISTPLNAGTHTISIAFTNDFNGNGEDRNLIVDEIIIRSVNVQTSYCGDQVCDANENSTTCLSDCPLAAQVENFNLDVRSFTTKTAGGNYGNLWNLWSNGYVAESFTTLNHGTLGIEINAAGQLAGNEPPQMQLLLNGNVLNTFNVNTPLSQTFTYQHSDLPAGTHEIRLAYLNDYFHSTQGDRNLLLSTVNLTLTPTNQPNFFCGDNIITSPEECDDGNTASGDGCSSSCLVEDVCGDNQCGATENQNTCPADCLQSFAYSIDARDFDVKTVGGSQGTGWNIWSNGYIEQTVNFPVSGQYEFVIFALGQLAGNDFPNMNVYVNGLLINSLPVSNRSSASFRLQPTTTYIQGNHTVRIEFDNDFYHSSQGDRNLVVERLEILSAVANQPTCGDGVITTSLNEQCDDGNIVSGDGCSATCTIEEICGDGLITGSELCDVQSVQNCTDSSGYPGTQLCNATCSGFESTCVSNLSCGDGTCTNLVENFLGCPVDCTADCTSSLLFVGLDGNTNCLDNVNPLPIPSIANGNALHPDVVYIPEGIDGYSFWMVHTPYPPESAEQPFLVRSNDGLTWTDAGLSNPIVNTTDAPENYPFDSDPDILYIAEYQKWFMVWSPRYDQNPREHGLAFAYSDDGVNWTEYDGARVNGNTNPSILSGSNNSSGKSVDDQSQAWERNSSGFGQTQYPSMIYENGTFTLFYGETNNGNNVGQIGCSTFQWNDSLNSIQNMNRCTQNPIVTLPADDQYRAGLGHVDVGYDDNGVYHMYAMRVPVNTTRGEIVHLTSTDKINWMYHGTVVPLGSFGEWDDYWIYRGSVINDGTGRIVEFNNRKLFYYSAYSNHNTTRIGILDITDIEGVHNPSNLISGLQTPPLINLVWPQPSQQGQINLQIARLDQSRAPNEQLLVSGGIPFPEGQLYDQTQLTFLQSNGNELPVARNVLARWPDQSIRSILVQFPHVFANDTDSITMAWGQRQQTPNLSVTNPNWDYPEATFAHSAEWLTASNVFGELLPQHQTAFTNYDQNIDRHFSNIASIPWTGDLRRDGYYSTAHVFYQLYARRGNINDFMTARRELLHYRENHIHHSGSRIGQSTAGSQPRYLYVQALADDYYLTGDSRSLEVAQNITNYIMNSFSPSRAYYPPDSTRFWTERIQAFVLLNVLTFYELTLDQNILDFANQYLAELLRTQDAWPERGGFIHNLYAHDPGEGAQIDEYGGSPFMTGLLLEALIKHHRITNDHVTALSILKTVEWLINEGLAVDNSTFKYLTARVYEDQPGPVDLNLLIAHGFGYAYRLTGFQHELYREIGNRIFDRGVRDAYLGQRKHFNQNYRSSGNYLAYLLKRP